VVQDARSSNELLRAFLRLGLRVRPPPIRESLTSPEGLTVSFATLVTLRMGVFVRKLVNFPTLLQLLIGGYRDSLELAKESGPRRTRYGTSEDPENDVARAGSP
jgi:hypothetical protein